MYLDLLQSFDINPPFVVLLSLLDVKDYHLPPDYGDIQGHPIEEARLLLPEVTVSAWPSDLAASFKHAFDLVWQAMGLERSRNYDSSGKWVGQRK